MLHVDAGDHPGDHTGDHAIEQEFWRRYARSSHIITFLIVTINGLYVLATWNTGSHRPLLLGLNLAGLAGATAGLVMLPEQRIAVSPRRGLIFFLWIVAGAALVTVAVWADGGIHSPMAWLFPLAVTFTASVHRPSLVVASGGAALTGFIAVAVLEGGFSSAPAEVGVHGAYIVALTYSAAMAASVRWGHYDAQVDLRAELSERAEQDGLTGLLNHRSFHECLSQEFDESRRNGKPLALLLLDLDHFKTINDKHGHLVGDEVLRRVTAAIGRSTRTADLAARIGGEEFALILPATPPSDADAVARRLQAEIARIDDPSPVTVSIGVASGRDVTAPTELVAQADKALYAAKRSGRDRICHWQEPELVGDVVSVATP